MYHSMYIIYTNTIIGNQNTDEYMSEISAIYEHVLTVAADQLTTASRASLCIASPMVKVTEQCIANVASSGFRSSLVEVPWGTNLDAVVYLAANVDFSNTAALGFHHTPVNIPPVKLGETVIHRSFGSGIIINIQANSYLEIDFSGTIRKFQHPQAFVAGFLKKQE